MLTFDVTTKGQAAAAVLSLVDTTEEAVITWHHKVGTKPTVYTFPGAVAYVKKNYLDADSITHHPTLPRDPARLKKMAKRISQLPRD